MEDPAHSFDLAELRITAADPVTGKTLAAWTGADLVSQARAASDVLESLRQYACTLTRSDSCEREFLLSNFLSDCMQTLMAAGVRLSGPGINTVAEVRAEMGAVA